MGSFVSESGLPTHVRVHWPGLALEGVKLYLICLYAFMLNGASPPICSDSSECDRLSGGGDRKTANISAHDKIKGWFNFPSNKPERKKDSYIGRLEDRE